MVLVRAAAGRARRRAGGEEVMRKLLDALEAALLAAVMYWMAMRGLKDGR